MTRRLLAFYAPLSLMPFFIMLTHTMVDATIARLPNPEITLAAFAVAKSLSQILHGPTFVERHTIVSLTGGRRSLATIMRLFGALTAAIVAIMILVGWSPFAGWVFGSLIGLPAGPVLDLAVVIFRFLFILPAVGFFRNVMQGIAILLHRPGLVSAATAIRVVAAALVLALTVWTQPRFGVWVAVFVWSGGIGFEALVLFGLLRRRYGSLPAAVDARFGDHAAELPLSARRLRQFVIPLMAMPILGTVLPPLVNSGMTRLPEPVIGLASFSVALSLASLFASPVGILHQVVLSFYQPSDSGAAKRALRRFCAAVGAAVAAVMAIIALTPLGPWFARSVVGLTDELATPTMRAFAVLALLPLGSAVREFNWGVLMRQAATAAIGLGRIANLVALVSALVVASWLAHAFAGLGPSMPSAVLGAMCFLFGDIVEIGFLVIYNRRFMNTVPTTGGAPAS